MLITKGPFCPNICERSSLIFTQEIAELCARFDLIKTELQMTIHQYIILQKITVAKQLLCTGCDIQKLPQALGFSDYAHFAKTFKRLTGMTRNSLTKIIRHKKIPEIRSRGSDGWSGDRTLDPRIKSPLLCQLS